ncbi:MAG: Uma2 family endonuclease [Deltaproteobacteria bacterium]
MGGLSGRLIAVLDALIGDRPCVAHSSDLKIRVPKTKLATYADGAVVCGEALRDDEDPQAVTNPSVIVEVLSDSTERWDRTGKFRHYRKLESLGDYVLVSQHQRHIEVYSRDAAGRWLLCEAGGGETVPVSSLGGTIDVDRVYRGIALSPADPAERPGNG